MEQRPRFKPDPFKAENFYYNEEHDFCICPMGQRMRRIGTRNVKTDVSIEQRNKELLEMDYEKTKSFLEYMSNGIEFDNFEPTQQSEGACSL